jgi:tripartite-type tricarboxylate transporter receptor subunit TctC
VTHGSLIVAKASLRLRHWIPDGIRNDGRSVILAKAGIHVAALFSFVFAAHVSAQDTAFPKRANIEMTVLFPAGSSADVTARLLAQGMAKHLGANVVVVNRPGAGGAIGYKYVAAQKPDGYSVVWNSNSISTTYHSGQLAFDYHAFDPVARVLIESPVVAVRADSPWKTLADLIRDAKVRPGKITVANSGTGSHTHITSVALFKTAGAEVLDVPYSAAQIVPSLLGGHVDAMVQLPGALAGQVQSGALRILAAVTQKRDPAFPDVPTAQEQGVDVALDAWRGIAVPRGTPKNVVTALESAVQATIETPEFAQGCEKLNVRPAFLPAREFGELVAKEDVQLARIIQSLGLKK